MSLGVKLLWRVRSRISLFQGLSLVPRESWNPLFGSPIDARCWFSSSTESPPPAHGPESLLFRKYNIAGEAETAEAETARAPSEFPYGAPDRRSLKRVLKKRKPSPLAAAMIKRPIRYFNQRAFRRSMRKHMVSTRQQVLHEYTREVLGKPVINWQAILDFMLQHTPKFGEILDFKVEVEKGAAAQARAALSELDTNLWQIQQRNHCKIHIESGSREDEPLIISLSGTNIAVRESLSDLVRAIGKISAVRVLDPALQISSSKVWEGNSQDQIPIQPLGNGEAASEDDTSTVCGHTARFVRMAKPRMRKFYRLTTRAEEIPRPTVWTKTSFEEYVAKLVFAKVPTHLHQSLYLAGSDHQSTVVHILTELFSSEDLRAAVSVTALKTALRYIYSRGPAFRPAARTLFYQAELQHLPLDAEAFQTFLTSASRAGDLDGFHSCLKLMYRKGHYMRVETWTAFLSMIQDPRIKHYIMRRMKSRRLHLVRPVLEEVARQNIILDLEGRTGVDISIQRLLHIYDGQYGSSWLDTHTLNRMIDVIGAHGNIEACYELLDLVDGGQRVRPDHYTLNTMMTHTRSIPQKIALLSRWPSLGPDAVTYQQLFKTACRQRLPNMLRVIWRYSAFAGLLTSYMRHSLTPLMRPEVAPKNRQAFLQAWEDVIFGRSELAAMRYLAGPRNFGATQLIQKYLQHAGNMRPIVSLEAKLQEAYDMDMRIHKLNKEGTEVPSSMRESLTVTIPLGFRHIPS